MARGGLRFYGIGDRPASDDGVFIAPGFTQFDLHLGYRQRWFDITFDIENLFNATFRAAQFATVSRLPGEPAVGAPVPAGFGCGSNARLATDPGGGGPVRRLRGHQLHPGLPPDPTPDGDPVSRLTPAYAGK